MKIILTVLLSLSFSTSAFAGDLGKVQADRILEILSTQEDGSIAYEDSYGGAPYLVRVSNTEFSIRPVEGKNLKQKATLYFKPRYELVMTKKDSQEFSVVDSGNLFIRDGKIFSNIREQTRTVDKEAQEDINNINLYVSCAILQYGNYGLEHVSTCRN